ncbi:MAG: NAD-dependent succinate-semialdehyde dehydrogenase [Bacteroidetes bacterium]|nr:MAG: NAD-dependent succinate-semialdehyde dehydrogenase [Bacteroidota bacterium]
MSLQTLKLSNKNLVQTNSFINGRWKSSVNTFPITNPATGETLAEVADVGVEEAELAVQAAHAALSGWSGRSAQERQKTLEKWHSLILQNSSDLAQLMTAEMGKPIVESRGEVQYGASFIKWFGEEGKRVYGDIIPSPKSDRKIVTLKQPIGVCVAITPWNFPLAMITRKIAPALAAGCTVVIKPAEDTPLTALALAELSREAGFPDGVINIITCSKAESVGTHLTTHPLVRKISFTGSTEVGRILMKNAAQNIAKISLELGGNAPFIVFDDADIPSAVEGAIASKYRNAGQTCVCANRILVQSGVYDAFIKAFTEKVRALNVGNGMDEGVQIGPLINAEGIEKVESLLADATSKGAKVTTGGSRNSSGDLFFQPTVIEGVKEDMKMSSEEIFGPVSPIYKFETEEEAIEMANNTIYGLASYFYARDIGRIWRVSEALEYGMVGVNTGLISTEVAPFGGIKQSGMGREGSKYGIEDYIEVKYVAMDY